MSHKLVFIFCLFFSSLAALVSCNTKEMKDAEKPAYTVRLQGDSAVYGLACDGCNDTSGGNASWARCRLATAFA